MQPLIALWQALDPRRRLIVGVATLGMFAAVLALSGLAGKPSMALLYAGLESARAGEVVAALDQRAVVYEVRGDSIYVEAPRRDELRMALAGEGLPATGGAGYELLDSLSGFGTTSQMFDAAYWRAKEGELARTIVANPAIRSARVHIASSGSQPFRKESRPTASVAVGTAAGGLSPNHAKALKYLVASAVSGMSPDDVSVIDEAGGLIGAGEETSGTGSTNDRAVELKKNVERLLEARVGYGNAVVEVSVETVTEREAITERIFDPETRVAISTDTEERTDKADDTRPGAVTVASNLPEGDAGSGAKSQSQSSETRERTNYEVSETTREVVRAPGAIRRLSVAALVDGLQVTDATGATTWQPRPDEELSALKDLIASAVGFDEARGDVITLRSLAFEPVVPLGTPSTPGILSSTSLDLMNLVQIAVLSVVALILGIFVIRPILTQPVRSRLAEPSAPAAPGTRALTGEIEEREVLPGPMTVVSDFDIGGRAPPMGVGAGFGVKPDISDPVARLKRLIDERQTESVEILRSWMEDHEEKAG